MAAKSSATMVALVLALNLIFFTMTTTACGTSCYNNPTPVPTPTTPVSHGGPKCPIDTLKFGVCANVLNGLVNVELGQPPKKPCCSLVEGLVDLEAAVCLCTALKANVLGIHLNLPINLSLLLNYCGKTAPTGFQCA